MQFGLIGEHLGHSFSKVIHNLLGSYDYELKELAPEALSPFMEARKFRGINVTIPYKEKVIPLLDEIDTQAKAIGAVNTVVNSGGKLSGYNTDFFGMRALFKHAGICAQDKKLAILGTGGTSKTAHAVAESLGATKILKVSRTAKDGAITYLDLYQDHDDTQVIINTTPVGMFPKTDAKPVDVSKFPKLSGVVDVIYNPLKTELIKDAQKYGIPAQSGLYMLVA
ncbi:MAG: shikimate dehydrogenase, partial [Eggerthellaceae bacterium]|nr:shikimate dehydrogenase [Eggerthellaceae bacterium]